jgi:PKD repeat protein
VTFNASESYDINGYIASYSWNFGDGNIMSTTNPIITHVYQIEGSYTARLTVFDNEGFNGTTTSVVNIRNYPTANYVYSPATPFVDEGVTFDASSSLPRGGIITSYSWNFGDGNSTTVSFQRISHKYRLPGSYTVTLTVSDSEGLSSPTTSKVINVASLGPTAKFTWNPTAPQVNATISFDGSSSTLGWNGTAHPPIQSYTWNFGDGNITTKTSPTITHVYRTEGNYSVTLTVTDKNGLSDSVTHIVEATSLPPWDLNKDGVIDIVDVATVAYAYGSNPGDPRWNPICDLDGNGTIDIVDVAMVAYHYGESYN